MSASRPPHIIAPDEVDAWLADSAVRAVTYHNTDRRAAASILREGPNVERSWFGSYGQGFYTTTVPDPFFGEVAVSVAIRIHQPLIGSIEEMGTQIDGIARGLSPLDWRMTPMLARRVRLYLVSAGYDGIVVYDAGGDGVDYVIALINGIVRIVVDR